MSSRSVLEEIMNYRNAVYKYFIQKPTKKDSDEPSSEIIESISCEKTKVLQGVMPKFYKITLQQAYEHSEFLGFLENFFKEKELDFRIAICLPTSTSEESPISKKFIQDIFCEAMNKYKERNNLY